MSLSDLKAALKEAAEKRSRNSAPVESDEVLFERAYTKLKAERSKDSSGAEVTASALPPLHSRLPQPEDAIRTKLREEARAEFLQRRSKALLDNEELKQLWTLLDSHAQPSEPLSSSTSSASEVEQMLDYGEYRTVASRAGPKCAPFFTAAVFAKLQQGDPKGRVSVMALFNYVMRKVWLHQTRIGLSLYDVTGQG